MLGVWPAVLCTNRIVLHGDVLSEKGLDGHFSVFGAGLDGYVIVVLSGAVLAKVVVLQSGVVVIMATELIMAVRHITVAGCRLLLLVLMSRQVGLLVEGDIRHG